MESMPIISKIVQLCSAASEYTETKLIVQSCSATSDLETIQGTH